MNLCGIISEFNPFHNGHEFLIQKAKEITGSEIVCVMSGDFVQRGDPAIIDKFERARCAIVAGADAVIELPTIYACSNAENFAFGAIKILKSLGAKFIAFGVENASLETLKQVAKLKFENSEKFKEAFKNEIQNGINFNTALKRSIAKNFDDENVLELLNKPNNILAIEYLTAILKLDAKIVPIAVERCDNGFLSEINNDKFLSASSIRNLILENQSFNKYVPKYSSTKDVFGNKQIEELKKLMLFKIRNSDENALEKFYDYSEGIEFRIKKLANECNTFDELLSEVSTARYRQPRMKKLLLYPLLGVTKSVINISTKTKPVARLLAIKKDKKNILKSINKSKISLIVTNSDYENLTKKQKLSADIDICSSNVYNLFLDKPNNLDKKTGTLFI